MKLLDGKVKVKVGSLHIFQCSKVGKCLRPLPCEIVRAK